MGLQAAKEVIDVILWHVPLQVSQVGVEFDKNVERDPGRTALLVLRQQLASNLEGTYERLRRCTQERERRRREDFFRRNTDAI